MRYTSVGEENKIFFTRVWKPLPVEGKYEKENLKKTTSASDGPSSFLALFQLFSYCLNL